MRLAKKIELLAPAKNAEIGIAAVDHGADAVYIGAPNFSARAAAGNSIEDIKKLIDYAHRYWAKVYVALNTIIYDSEIPEVERLIHDLYSIGTDALIIQDMSILNMSIPPISLHASTQCNNRDLDKIQFLEKAGFSQVVLARELSLDQIKDISAYTNITLEAFIHGALCVSYSGNCYISEALSGRSANRGECAQFCRMPYTLTDSSGKIIVKDRHILSLKDLNHSENLEKLIDAGISSLKIEGRLKDLSYVKNVTAHYRRKLDEIFEKRPEYIRSSSGNSTFFFASDPAKSFNRGFTDYFLHGRSNKMVSPETPKSIGETIGTVKDLSRDYFTLSGNKIIHNGDGLCFLNEKKELQGFRVNKVIENKIYPAKMPLIDIGTTLYRNFDQEFEKTLEGKTAERKIKIRMILSENNFGFSLGIQDEDACSATVSLPFPKEMAQKSQEENMYRQLSKLGNTYFELEDLKIDLHENWFIPSSVLSDLRRKAVDSIQLSRKLNFRQEKRIVPAENPEYIKESLDYTENIANQKARDFFMSRGVKTITEAFENNHQKNIPVMTTKYCIKYQLGYCPKYDPDKSMPFKEPFTLSTGKHILRLKFDCKKCEMQILQ